MPLACPSCGAPLSGNPAEPCEERDLHFPDTSTVEGRRTVWERLAIAAETLSAPQNAYLLTQAARALAAAEDEIAALSRAQPPPDESLKKAIVVIGDISAAHLDVLARAEYVIHVPRDKGAYIWKHREGMDGWELRTYGQRVKP